LCTVYSQILSRFAPRFTAVVTSAERSECAAKSRGVEGEARGARFAMSATVREAFGCLLESPRESTCLYPGALVMVSQETGTQSA
jgi:hypothetical protein